MAKVLKHSNLHHLILGYGHLQINPVYKVSMHPHVTIKPASLFFRLTPLCSSLLSFCTSQISPLNLVPFILFLIFSEKRNTALNDLPNAEGVVHDSCRSLRVEAGTDQEDPMSKRSSVSLCTFALPVWDRLNKIYKCTVVIWNPDETGLLA